jgi:hypothetical protein
VKAGVRARGVPGILSRHAVDPHFDQLEIRSFEGVDFGRRVWVVMADGASAGVRQIAERLLAEGGGRASSPAGG